MEKTFLKILSFDDFEIDTERRLLMKNGQPVTLNPKALDLLTILVRNRGEVLSKEELLDKVWEGQFVEENNLTVHISALRKIFGEKKGAHKYIVTVPGKGYKFVAGENLRSNNLPAPTNQTSKLVTKNFDDDEAIIGRAAEIAEIKSILRSSNKCLLTLTGAGGSGKTKLARTIADEMQTEFEDSVFFVELAAVNRPELVAGAIAQVFNLQESSGKPVFDALKEFLRELRVLLVLDNFEQLLSAVSLIKELLDSASNLKILVTSRAPLHIKTEQEKVVQPLAVPPPNANLSAEQLSDYAAVELFTIRARKAKANFALDKENAPIITKICSKLDGLPLAIELAAARIKLLSLQAILTRLENSLKLLTGGARDLPERQRTIRDTILWSYELLDKEEKVLFRRLAVFAGGFSVEAAEFVGEEEIDETMKSGSSVLDLLGSLVDNNLLVSKEQPDGNVQLRMLEVVREFAFDCLEASGETGILRQSHARFYLFLAEEADPHLTGEKAVEWLEKLEVEIDNFRAALRWTFENDSETAIRMTVALRNLWLYHSHFAEGSYWLKAGLEQSAGAPHELRFKLLSGLGILMRVHGDYDTARKLYLTALDEGKAAGDNHQIARSSSGLGTVLQLQGDYQTARKYFEEALEISRQLNDEHSIAHALLCLGISSGINGRSAEARQYLEESLSILRRISSKEAVSNTLNNLGAVTFDEGDYNAALTYFAEGLQMSREVGNKVNIIDALNGFAALAERRKEPELAAVFAGSAQNLTDSIEYHKDPAERQFCETYLAKVRAALDEKTFLTAFEQGYAMNLNESVALTKVFDSQFVSDLDEQETEIVIENHSFSQIVIEEEIEFEGEGPETESTG